MSEVNWAAWLPVIALGVGLVGYSLIDMARHEVRYLPKWGWAVICLLSIPLGAVVYLLVGRDRASSSPSQ